MSNDDILARLARIEGHLDVIGSRIDVTATQVNAIAARLAANGIDEAINDALAIHGLVAQINEVVHQQRIDLATIADAQTVSAAQSESDRADVTTLLTRLHTLALRHATRLTSWERAQLEAADAARSADTTS